MRWMKFTCHDGQDILLNMAHCVSIYVTTGTLQAGTYLEFGDGPPVGVTDTPDEIIARGQWEVR